jgi:hypothetical protein
MANLLIVDKSALVRIGASPDAGEWAARMQRGLVRITTVTRLEIWLLARSGPNCVRQRAVHRCRRCRSST